MSHISYAMIVHAATGRIVYKTRNKSGGTVEPAYRDVIKTADASSDVNGNKTLVALIDVVADLHNMTASDVKDLVVAKLKDSADA